MTAIELADRLHHERETILRIDAEHAGEMLRKQDVAIKQLREALGDISYAVEWGGDVKEAQEKADAALAATEEFK
jgi:hypothetical protein